MNLVIIGHKETDPGVFPRFLDLRVRMKMPEFETDFQDFNLISSHS